MWFIFNRLERSYFLWHFWQQKLYVRSSAKVLYYETKASHLNNYSNYYSSNQIIINFVRFGLLRFILCCLIHHQDCCSEGRKTNAKDRKNVVLIFLSLWHVSRQVFVVRYFDFWKWEVLTNPCKLGRVNSACLNSTS